MRRPSIVALTIALGLSGCAQEPSSPTGDELVLDTPLDLTEPPSGGSCPNVYWESEELLDDGLTVVRWTSGFGGFEYEQGADYTGLVAWSVDGGSATLTSAGIRSGGHTWTPRGQDSVDGTLVSVDPPFTVNMFDMHRGDEDIDGDGIPDWRGQIGNGHFWVVLHVDGMNNPIKLGVNYHLEDPDDGYSSRCPTG